MVQHAGGPLLVLAGPGTGKTTTLVEGVAERVEGRGLDPEQVLVLTFSRKAAGELRQRAAQRLRRTTTEPLAFTFHSYAYALLRREAALAGEPAPRLLSGPEQLLEVRRLLAGELEDGGRHWPERLRSALQTRGFAAELSDLLQRARERGLGGAGLVELGHAHGCDEWVAAGHFLRRYAARFAVDPVPVYDYTGLVHAAAGYLERDDVRRRERAARPVVFVDEYQDTDPAQERLLQLLAGDGHELVAVGDPDQSIYGFRGTDVRGILEFPDRFRSPGGRPAPVVALRTCRRSGPELLRSSRQVARKLPAPPGSGDHRTLHPQRDAGRGTVSAHLAGSAGEEAALVADTLRRAHLLDGVPWSEMAVLVRSAVRQLPDLRRALSAAGVPCTAAGDEVPLAEQPAIQPLLRVLRLALRPASLDQEDAENLLTGPIGRTDALGLRRLCRALRQVQRQAGGGCTEDSLLVQALSDPGQLALVESGVAAPATRASAVLTAARRRAAEGGTVEDILWTVWEASGLAERWLAYSAGGGQRGATADRDLDAVVALFDAAARFTDRMPRAGAEVFLADVAGQEIPGDSLTEQAPAGEAVRLLTAHRAKGLEWDVVAVAGVQEGVWPDLRLRGSTLGIEELVETAATGSADPAAVTSKLLDEERRLFYVAATRARHRLVVTAVDSDEATPSRFVAEVAPRDPAGSPVTSAPSRWLSLPALVADLRAVVTDPERPEPLRRNAATHLARLAREGVRGAHPREWYGLTCPSDRGPLVAPGAPVRVSPSQIERFQTCPLRWLLETAAGAGMSQPTQHLGSVIHAVAKVTASHGSVDIPTLSRELDRVWHELDFGSPWFSRRQRAEAERMVSRFAGWHQENPRELVATETRFEVPAGRARIEGMVDRLERDADGRLVVVDLKTGRSQVPPEELARHPQLGVYQLAVHRGGLSELGPAKPGGAELVQLGKAAFTHTARTQRQDSLAEAAEPDWALDLVAETAEGMAAAAFPARINEGCRSCPVRSACPARAEGAQVTG